MLCIGKSRIISQRPYNMFICVVFSHINILSKETVYTGKEKREKRPNLPMSLLNKRVGFWDISIGYRDFRFKKKNWLPR